MTLKPGAYIKTDKHHCCLACGQSCLGIGSDLNDFEAFALSEPARVRSFPSGATRDTDQGKIDYEGYLSPLALEAFGKYMLKHQYQSDHAMRSSDNWQKGIPIEAYMKSAWRHFFAVWRGHRGTGISVDDLCALMFNVQGLLHETLKKEEKTDGN